MLFSQNIITAEEIPLEGQSISESTSGWIAQNSSTTETLYGISFIDSNFGTIVGEGGTIIHTSDGTTWSPQSSGVTLRLCDVSFLPRKVSIELPGWLTSPAGPISFHSSTSFYKVLTEYDDHLKFKNLFASLLNY